MSSTQAVSETEHSFYIWVETSKKLNVDSYHNDIHEGKVRCHELLKQPGIVRAVLMGNEGIAYQVP